MIVLTEGKNREIRRMVEALGNHTKRLERMAIGDLRRGMLKPGEWRFMTRRDIARILMLDENDPEVEQFSANLRRTPAHPVRGHYDDHRRRQQRAPRRPSRESDNRFE